MFSVIIITNLSPCFDPNESFLMIKAKNIATEADAILLALIWEINFLNTVTIHFIFGINYMMSLIEFRLICYF